MRISTQNMGTLTLSLRGDSYLHHVHRYRAKVVIGDLDEAAAKSVEDEIKSAGGSVNQTAVGFQILLGTIDPQCPCGAMSHRLRWQKAE